MKHDTISLRRRHLIIAGVAGIATPAGVYARLCGDNSAAAPSATGVPGSAGGLVVSGRVVGPDRMPFAGAAVEAWQTGETAQLAAVITDADGRFVFTADAGIGRGRYPQSLSFRVTHPRRGALTTRTPLARTQILRDESGNWRTTVGLTLA